MTKYAIAFSEATNQWLVYEVYSRRAFGGFGSRELAENYIKRLVT